ncbi:MAG: hypothetical protein OXF48_05855, partial [Bacteroidetes bacterium]|nr:hypothetical protein [Bacteroidota bacterium]
MGKYGCCCAIELVVTVIPWRNICPLGWAVLFLSVQDTQGFGPAFDFLENTNCCTALYVLSIQAEKIQILANFRYQEIPLRSGMMKKWCPGLESNQHARKGTAPS